MTTMRRSVKLLGSLLIRAAASRAVVVRAALVLCVWLALPGAGFA